jgi:hypothetical protein
MCGEAIWSLGSRGGARAMLMSERFGARCRGRGIEGYLGLEMCLGCLPRKRVDI